MRTLPDFYPAHAFLGIAYVQQGSFAEAIAALERARQLENVPGVAGWLGHACRSRAKTLPPPKDLTTLRSRHPRSDPHLKRLHPSALLRR